MADKPILSVNSKMECPLCKGVYTFIRSYHEAECPITLVCPNDECDYSYTILADDHRFRMLPRVDPSRKIAGAWGVEVSLEVDPTIESLASELGSTPKEVKQLSFSKKLDEASISFLTGLRIISTIKDDLSAVADQFRMEIEQIYHHGHMFREGFDPSQLMHFLSHPFSAFDADAVDGELAYAKYILCPRFYKKMHGLPLTTEGGFYLQLICPYSELYFPVESWVRLELGLETQKPKLWVTGGKIHGDPAEDWLDNNWSQIPGVEPDEDHSVNNTSLVISNKRMTRNWLVKNGHFPFHKTPTSPLDIMTGNREFLLAENEVDINDALNVYLESGRMALAWGNRHEAKAACIYMGTTVRGIKLILTGEREQLTEEDSWTGIIGKRFNGWNTFTRHSWKEFEDIRSFSKVSLLIVDVASGIPAEFLDQLHDYAGKLILVLPDPLMDTLEENELAAACYSLCNGAHVNPGKEWKNAWLPLREQLTPRLSQALALLGVKE